MSEENPDTTSAINPPEETPTTTRTETVIAESASTYLSTYTPLEPSDISDTLKQVVLPNVSPDAISHEQAHAGVSVHIPGSVKLCQEDVIVFYWGKNVSSTTLFHRVGGNSIVRVLCISYNFIPFIQYGLIDLYYEVFRDERLIGTSPVLRVNVNYSAPVTPRQRQRKRSINGRYPGS
ncbi:hypothetical protein [Pseudomonas californiensis]|uniref:hypothetical protein n=1 Tax=Pseudomonas californiensis TaxID=2829823 RepID=UPI003872B73E